MNIQEIILEQDLATLQKWWADHKALPVPELFLQGAKGYFCEAAGVRIAALFVYLGAGCKFAMVEFITTNPACAFSRDTAEAVHVLLNHAEKVALEAGCVSILSMVEPGSSGERIIGRMGYITSAGPSHRLWGKALKEIS